MMESELPLECDFCPQKFAVKSQLYRHLATHAGEESAVSSVPKELSTRNVKIKNSLNSKLLTTASFKCEVCGTSFQSRLRLKLHGRIHGNAKQDLKRNKTSNSSKYTSLNCEDVYAKRKEAAVNPNNKDTEKANKGYKKLARDEPKMSNNLHVRRRPELFNNLHTCFVCGKTFKNKFYLKKHEAKHLDRAFVCAVCGKDVGDERGLQKHEVTHCRVKNYKCQFCDKMFTIEQHALLHQNLYHKLLATGLNAADSDDNNSLLSHSPISETRSSMTERTKKRFIDVKKKWPSHNLKFKKMLPTLTTKRRPGRPAKPVVAEKVAPDNDSDVPLAPAPTMVPLEGVNQQNILKKGSPTHPTSPDYIDNVCEYNALDSPEPSSSCEVCEVALKHDAVARKLHGRFHRSVPKNSPLFRRHILKAFNNDSSRTTNSLTGGAKGSVSRHKISYPDTSATDLLRSNLNNLSAIQPHILNTIFDTSFWAFNKMDENNLFCLYCDIRFNNINDLKHHYFTHLASPRFECDTCGETFDTKVRLQDHIILHQLDVTFMCNLCSRVFSSQEQLKAHEVNHHNLELMARVANLTGGRCLLYTCNACGKNFDRQEKYEIHYQLYHSSKGPFRCAFCHLDFDQKILLLKHLKRYHKTIYKPSKFRCVACRLSFPNEYLLREHEFSHDDIKRFSCQVCGSLFRQIYNVNNHIRKCHGEMRGVEYIIQRNEITQNESLLFATESEFIYSGLQTYPIEKNYANNLRRNDNFFEESDLEIDDKDAEAGSIVFGEPDAGLDDLAELYEVWQCATCGNALENAYEFSQHVAPGTLCSEDTYECPRCFFVTKDRPIFNAHFHTDFHFHQQNNFLLYNSLRLLSSPTITDLKAKATNTASSNLSPNKVETKQEYDSLVHTLLTLRPNEKSKSGLPTSINESGSTLVVLKCDMCHSQFTNKSNYGRHIVLHNTVVPYECYLCGQAFVVIENLKKHYLVHFYTLKSATFSTYHCISCNNQYDNKADYQSHGCSEELNEKNYKCVDCKHSFLTRDLFIGHVCLGNSESFPQYPMPSDYGIESATTQILSNYIPISQTLPIKDIIPYPMAHHSTQSVAATQCAPSTSGDHQTHPFEFVYRGNGTVFDEHGVDSNGQSTILPFMQNMSLDLPEQFKFSSFMDPYKRPITTENPWEEYWPKNETLPGQICNLAICQREYRMYEAIFTVKPARLPLIHLRTCDVTKLYCCEGCDHSFRERKILDEHIITIHFNNLPPHYFLCNICGKFSRAGRSFKVHLERHYAENKFLCDQCALAFPSKSQLKSHYQSHSGILQKILKCPICSREFSQRNELNYHMYNHTGLKPYVCNVCSKSYVKRTKLLEHMKVHTGERPYKCYSCGEAFPHRKFLQEHIAMAHGNQTFKCPQCDKTFSYEPHLIRHAKIHSGHNPYTCHICDKDFFRKEKLQRHLFVHDSNTLYKCDVCHKGYSTREVLEKHICVREKGCENIVFKCPLCPRKFTFKKNLELHIAHHQPNEVRNDRKKVAKQYYCNLCPKAFVHLKKLNRHLIFHQKYPNFEGGIPIIVEEKKFKCHLCPKTFIKNFYLKKHLENHFKYSGARRIRTNFNIGTNLSATQNNLSYDTRVGQHSSINNLSGQNLNLISSNPLYLIGADGLGGHNTAQVSWSGMNIDSNNNINNISVIPESFLTTVPIIGGDAPGSSTLYYHGSDGPGGVDSMGTLDLQNAQSASSYHHLMADYLPGSGSGDQANGGGYLHQSGSTAAALDSLNLHTGGGMNNFYAVQRNPFYPENGTELGPGDEGVEEEEVMDHVVGSLPMHHHRRQQHTKMEDSVRQAQLDMIPRSEAAILGVSSEAIANDSHNNLLNTLDPNALYTLVQFQVDGSLANSGSNMDENNHNSILKVIEQMQKGDQEVPNFYILGSDT